VLTATPIPCLQGRAKCWCGASFPCTQTVHHICSGWGLGDAVAGALSAVGITESRVSAALGKPCKCRERRQKLNAIGWKLGIGERPPATPDNNSRRPT
jgi:hypothetical protein